MKKIYNNLIGMSLVSLLVIGLSVPTYAQRGNDHSQGQSGGGSAQASRPAPQPQVQHSNPAPQRSSSSYSAPRTNAVGAASSQPRGVQHSQGLSFTQSGGQRHYRTVNGGHAVVAPRVGVAAVGITTHDYRTYPGVRYGGRGYVSPHPSGFFYQNRGYYRTYYAPQLGFRINILPRGYYPFYFDDSQYFYSGGLYYQQTNDDYTVVEPPIGASIEKLPPNAQSIAINGMQYYEANGVYYQPVTRDDGSLVYQIAGKDGQLNVDTGGSTAAQDDTPQIGDLVNTLPEGCKIVRLAGQKFYVSQEGYYFQDAVDTNGDKAFKIVGTPEDQPGN